MTLRSTQDPAAQRPSLLTIGPRRPRAVTVRLPSSFPVTTPPPLTPIATLCHCSKRETKTLSESVSSWKREPPVERIPRRDPTYTTPKSKAYSVRAHIGDLGTPTIPQKLKPAVFAASCRSLAMLTETLQLARGGSCADKATAVNSARMLIINETLTCHALTAHVNRIFLKISQRAIYGDRSGLSDSIREIFEMTRICTPPRCNWDLISYVTVYWDLFMYTYI